MKVGYMTSLYPARSHTFIRREIEELEKLGFNVMRYSQRKYDRSEILNPAEADEYERTWSIHPSTAMRFLADHCWAIKTNLRRYVAVFFSALRKRPPEISGVFYALVYFVQAICLAKKLHQDQISVLHIHFVNSGGYIGTLAAEFADIPWGASVHGRSDFDYPGVHALRWAIKSGSFLRCISQFGASQAMRQCHPSMWPKIFVSYCGLPDDLLTVKREERAVTTVPVILSLGRLSPEKGQFLLLDAVSILKAKNIRFRLIIVGDGPDREALQARVRELDLAAECEFTGAVDEAGVMAEMARADVFVCPSLMEGLPQVLMEAMAVKLPLVAPYLSGIPELVEHRNTGCLFYAGDSEHLARSIEMLLVDDELASACAQRGYQRLSSDFLLSGTIVPLSEKLREIMGSHQ